MDMKRTNEKKEEQHLLNCFSNSMVRIARGTSIFIRITKPCQCILILFFRIANKTISFFANGLFLREANHLVNGNGS